MEGSYGQNLVRQGGRFGVSPGSLRWRHQRTLPPDGHDKQPDSGNLRWEGTQMTLQGVQSLRLIV